MFNRRKLLTGVAALTALLAINGEALSWRLGTKFPVLLGTIGDSIQNISSITTTAIPVWDFPLSGSVTNYMDTNKSMISSLYGQAYYVANGGISGQTIQQWIDRSGLPASSTRKSIEDVCSLSNVIIIGTGIVSLVGGVTAATAFSQLTTVVNTCLALKKKVIITTCYGYSGVVNTAPTQAALVTFNGLCQGLVSTNCAVLTTIGVTCDGTGAYLAGMDLDGTHPGPKCGQAIAGLILPILNNWFGTSSGNRFIGSNLIPNANLATTGSQAYGTVGTGWAIQASNTTRANAKVETISGMQLQTCEFTPTADNGNGEIDIPFALTGGSPTIPVVAGQTYGFECDFYIGGLAGAAPPNLACLLLVDLQTTSAHNQYEGLDIMSSAGKGALASPLAGHIAQQPIVIPAGGSSINLTSTLFRLKVFMQDSGDRTPFKIGVGSPNMVLLS